MTREKIFFLENEIRCHPLMGMSQNYFLETEFQYKGKHTHEKNANSQQISAVFLTGTDSENKIM